MNEPKATTETPEREGDCSPASCSAEIDFLILEAENMALTLESLGFGRHIACGKMCTPVERYRKKFPRQNVSVEGRSGDRTPNSK